MRFVVFVGVLAVASGQIIAQEESPEIVALEDDPNRDVSEPVQEEDEMNADEVGDASVPDGVTGSSEVEAQHRCGEMQCNEGEGDCNKNSECKGGNVCQMNSCKKKYTKKGRNWMEWADCCGPVGPFDWDYCKLMPCGDGDGDCDSHKECAPGLKCGVNNCRAKHPDVPHNEMHKKLDCCTRCSEVRVGPPGSLTKLDAEYFDAQKEVAGTERKLVKPPAIFEPAAVWNLPALGDGDVIKLTCCKRRGSVCEFFITVYQCKPCSEDLNGGLPPTLVTSGWDAGACAPRFELSGGAPVSHAMTSFHMTLTAGQTEVIPISKDAPHVAVFERSGPLTAPWCPPPTGPHLPGPPCECIPMGGK